MFDRAEPDPTHVAFATPVASSSSHENGTSRVFDRLAIAVIAAVGVLSLLTFRDYGLSWDDYAHSEYGDLLLSLYTSGFADRRALSFVNLYYYGGGFDLLAAALAKILPFRHFRDAPAARRRGRHPRTGSWCGAFGRRIGGPLAGLLALVLLACCPEYYGHMFMNPKDSPFAVAMAILLLGPGVRVRTISAPQRPGSTGAGRAGCPLSLGARIMGAFGLIGALAAVVLIFAVEVRPAAPAGWSAAWTFSPGAHARHAAGIRGDGAGVALGRDRPAQPVSRGRILRPFFEEPWQELFDGRLVSVLEMPRAMCRRCSRSRCRRSSRSSGLSAPPVPSSRPRTGNATSTGAPLSPGRARSLLPVAIEIALRPAMYNGIRHFVFVLPPLAVLGGLAGAFDPDRAKLRRPARIAAALVFIAGVGRPSSRWSGCVLTNTPTSTGWPAALRAHAVATCSTTWDSPSSRPRRRCSRTCERGKKQPAGRRWKIAVCGPHRSPQVELGPDFETSWDPRGADFAMMLGEFYCAGSTRR